MNIEETKKITLSLIETFNEAGRVALNLRNLGFKKKNKRRQYSSHSNGDIEVNKILT